jgi:large subunit ribosomal protein L10Ae
VSTALAFLIFPSCDLVRLPNVPRPRMSICILADAADIDRAKQIDLEYMSVDDLKK